MTNLPQKLLDIGLSGKQQKYQETAKSPSVTTEKKNEEWKKKQFIETLQKINRSV